MSSDPTKILPPDDSGSDTFSRYRYQAKLIFPFFLRCGLGGSEVLIIPEHIEDICVQTKQGKWRFLQVKSRDVSRGYWTFSDLTSAPDGALLTLSRTYKATKTVDATYELHLEQPLAPRGDVSILRDLSARKGPSFLKKICKVLTLTKKEASHFLDRLVIYDKLPQRETIDAANLHLIQSQKSGITFSQSNVIYTEALTLIEAAMAAEQPSSGWPAYMDPEPDSVQLARINAKKLTHEKCRSVLGVLSGPANRLLNRTLAINVPPPSRLEAKLIAGGASQDVIDDAKLLRANAVAHEFEYLAVNQDTKDSFSAGKGELSEVHQRLRINVNSLIAKYGGESTPANKVWNEMREFLYTHLEKIDPNALFNKEPLIVTW